VPIALDESIGGDQDVGAWIDAGWTGYYVIKPALLGDATHVLARLQSVKARVVFSSSLETAVGAQAALREAFAWPGDAAALGFGVWPLFSDPAFDGPHSVPFLRIEDVEGINPEAQWTAAK
jgi:O-succinylbenzoate synthase